jgi:hypothetical protein
MQINAASLLAAQQARTPAAPQRTQAKPQTDDLFEPLFGKTEAKASVATAQTATPTQFVRPGSQVDIRI